MVPAAVLHQKKRNPDAHYKAGGLAAQGGFGLIPTTGKERIKKEPSPSKTNFAIEENDTYDKFLKSMKELGAL